MPRSGQKRRGVSIKAVEAMSDKLEQQQRQAELDKLLEEIVATLKARPDLRWAVKGPLDGKTQAGDPERSLPRGVRFLVGTSTSNGVPTYVLFQAVTDLCAADAADLKGMEDYAQNVGRLVSYATRASKLQLLPDTKMLVKDLCQWIADRHNACGAPLRQWAPSSTGAVDWNFAVGHFRFVDPDPDPGVSSVKSTVITSIQHRRTAVIKKIPQQFHVHQQEVGTVVRIHENWCELEATLVNVEDGDSLKLSKKLFCQECNDTTVPTLDVATSIVIIKN